MNLIITNFLFLILSLIDSRLIVLKIKLIFVLQLSIINKVVEEIIARNVQIN